MARFIIPLVFLVLALGSAGCRMCGSPYDLCTPAFLERHDDYRGCDPMYRSGSIFSRGGNDCYLGSDGGLLIADRSMNAGNFGVTVPVKGAKLPSKSPLESKNGTGSAIGIPNMDGWLDGDGFETPRSIEELLQDTLPDAPTLLETEPRTPAALPSEPSASPVKPPVKPMPFVEEPPQSEPTPPVEDLFRQIQNQSDGAEPTITLEDLKRLDPSVTDIEILDIADELDIPKR